MPLAPQEGEKGVQNLGLVVRNCTINVENYGTIIKSKFENGEATCLDRPSPTLQFDSHLQQNGNVYKIWGQLCKIL